MKRLTLKEQNETLKEELNIKTNIINKLKNYLSQVCFNKHADIEDNLKDLINDRDSAYNMLRRKEGLVDNMVYMLKEENTRLYYIIRVFAGDKTVELDKMKPGEVYDHDSRIKKNIL